MLKNYEILLNGVIKQKKIVKTIKEYNIDYVSERYNTYGEKGLQMAYLRVGYLLGSIKEELNSVLDVGYGNGDFLKVCSEKIKNCFGNDISNYPLPHGCVFVDDIFKDEYDLVCFFDSLEHFEEIDFVSKLKTKYVCVSLPWCHNKSDEWFENWKHRREDEHLWHFNDNSLVNFMVEMGYELVNVSNVEDTIRKSINEDKNILTGIFKKNI
jgi:hypothetical protein